MTDPMEQRLRATLSRVAGATPIPPSPSGAPAAGVRHHRRRRAMWVASGVAVLGVAAPAAAATGGASAVATAFGWTQPTAPAPPSGSAPESVPPPSVSTPPVSADPGGLTPATPPATVPPLPVIQANEATGHEVLSLTQDGQTWQVWKAAAVGGGQCVSILQPVTGGYASHGSECTAAVPASVQFGAFGADPTGATTFLDAPGAAYVVLSDGASSRRLPVGEGESAAWIPAAEFDRQITMTAYTATGASLGTTTSSFFDGLPKASGGSCDTTTTVPGGAPIGCTSGGSPSAPPTS